MVPNTVSASKMLTVYNIYDNCFDNCMAIFA